MEWICIKDKKPDKDITAYVMNVKTGTCFIALYSKDRDYFLWCRPDLDEKPPIFVTHWVELPSPYPYMYQKEELQRWND